MTGTSTPAVVTLSDKDSWEPAFRHTRPVPLYQALFNGNVFAGKNIITVKYQQPFMLHEYDYGYFTDGRFVEYFTYYLGPLKEWQLAEDFSLEISISSLRERPERDGGWSLRRARSIDCQLPGQVVENDSDNLNLRVNIGRDFPDTLTCKMGDSDLLDESQ